jgi:hypothetical protein
VQTREATDPERLAQVKLDTMDKIKSWGETIKHSPQRYDIAFTDQAEVVVVNAADMPQIWNHYEQAGWTSVRQRRVLPAQGRIEQIIAADPHLNKAWKYAAAYSKWGSDDPTIKGGMRTALDNDPILYLIGWWNFYTTTASWYSDDTDWQAGRILSDKFATGITVKKYGWLPQHFAQST